MPAEQVTAAGERRLRHAERLGGKAEVAMLGERPDDLDLPNRMHGALDTLITNTHGLIAHLVLDRCIYS